jgi:hypothetical protein
MWPGIRPATGVNRELHGDAALLQLIVEFAHLVLRLGDGHPVAGMMTTEARLFERLRRAFRRF